MLSVLQYLMCLYCFLQKGDIVLVTKMEKNGQWEGQIEDRKGIFPFTHVKFLDEDLAT